MEGKKDINDSFDEVKIYKPKPIRKCQQKKKQICASIKSSTTSANSEKSQTQINFEETKMNIINFDNVSIDEINSDFLMFEKDCDEEECYNEFWNILNNSSEKNFSESNYRNVPKIKRCLNNNEQRKIDFLNENNMYELFDEFNYMIAEKN